MKGSEDFVVMVVEELQVAIVPVNDASLVQEHSL